MPRRPTPDRAPVPRAPALRAGVLLLLAASGALLGAGPAAAAQDPGVPSATVTRGPSCEPGGVAVEVVAGTVPYHVVLATTRRPGGEDAADLAPGGTAVLHTGDVDWGETVDSRLVYTALDGSGASSADELDDWTMTRPSRADCAAIGAPAAVGATPPARAPGSPRPAAVVPTGAGRPAVVAGRAITVRAAGFQPGEDVVLRLHEGGSLLARGAAAADGSVQLGLTVPARARGQIQLDLVGRRSLSTAALQLEVAARDAGAAPARPFAPAPLLALLALLGSGGGLVAVARRAGADRRAGAPRGS